MKVKVISSYRDKITKKIHQLGEELDISKERADEILKVGKFIEVLEESKKPADGKEQEAELPKTKGKKQKKNNKSNEENAG